jgi:hypothetical protein
MLEPKRLLTVALVAASILSILVAAGGGAATNVRGQPTTTNNQTTTTSGNETMTSGEMEHQLNSTIVRDSQTVLLGDQTIPAGGFIHLYDTTPYSIIKGHVAARIPCGDDSTPLLNILVGVAPEFTPAPLELVANLSTPGELCLYHTDLPAPSEQANATTTANATTLMVTDIAISNPGDEDVTLPSTSTVVIGVNEIMPLEGAHGHEGESHAEGAGEEVS